MLLLKFTKYGDVVNFTTVACRITSRLKRYINYKNRLRLAKVIVKNRLPRFLWFTVYISANISNHAILSTYARHRLKKDNKATYSHAVNTEGNW